MRHAVPLSCLLLVLAGCTSSSTDPFGNPNCEKSTAVSNPAGHLHGHECTQNAECRYGICTKTALVLNGNVSTGVCTKDCSCGAGSQCSADNDGGFDFTCVKASQGDGSECAQRCAADADCTAINPAFKCLSSAQVSFQTAAKVCALPKP